MRTSLRPGTRIRMAPSRSADRASAAGYSRSRSRSCRRESNASRALAAPGRPRRWECCSRLDTRSCTRRSRCSATGRSPFPTSPRAKRAADRAMRLPLGRFFRARTLFGEGAVLQNLLIAPFEPVMKLRERELEPLPCLPDSNRPRRDVMAPAERQAYRFVGLAVDDQRRYARTANRNLVAIANSESRRGRRRERRRVRPCQRRDRLRQLEEPRVLGEASVMHPRVERRHELEAGRGALDRPFGDERFGLDRQARRSRSRRLRRRASTRVGTRPRWRSVFAPRRTRSPAQ